jgi:hypothetical protein
MVINKISNRNDVWEKKKEGKKEKKRYVFDGIPSVNLKFLVRIARCPHTIRVVSFGNTLAKSTKALQLQSPTYEFQKIECGSSAIGDHCHPL